MCQKVGRCLGWLGAALFRCPRNRRASTVEEFSSSVTRPDISEHNEDDEDDDVGDFSSTIPSQSSLALNDEFNGIMLGHAQTFEALDIAIMDTESEFYSYLTTRYIDETLASTDDDEVWTIPQMLDAPQRFGT
eukprot:TRINITY_DN5366_c0_g1_i1.p1 TRINITY_DN5366_c0_g1~~TRINITY_DN5366_c0_g1_i1.p1  ORF type:complete len:133 (+),score=24.75 TRINITY_DN5366_c0_g1_i1:79-477(+)